MNKMHPLVSVIMPIYNGERYCVDSIKSVLAQTYKHFELIIVDDGSTDNTKAILKSFTDMRIHIYTHIKNKGISESLNQGISKAKGDYIARIDADDLMLPNRLREQVTFLKHNLSVGVVGSYVSYFGAYNFLKKYPTTDNRLKKQMQFISPFCHPATLIRKSILSKMPYLTKYNGIEDLDLWWRLSEKTQFGTVPKVLTKYRIHDESITHNSMASMLIRSSHYRLERTKNRVSKITMIFLIVSLKTIFRKIVLRTLLFSQKHNSFFNGK